MPYKNKLGFSYIKVVLAWVVVLAIASGGFIIYKNYDFTFIKQTLENKQENIQKDIIAEKEDNENEGIVVEEDYSGIADDKNSLSSKAKEKSALISEKESKNPDDKSQVFNILVLGIDRRHASQTSWRTDVIQLITISPDRKNIVITHIPRDVWAGSYKINAVYNLKGPDAIKDEINKLTGQRPDRIIRIDFDAFVYAVDAVNGVTINNPIDFIDSSYPDDRNGNENIITVEFPKGNQVLDGEDALKYVRSRKGTNGEGSDYARGLRQQRVMIAIIADFFKPGNLFTSKTAETLYRIATEKIYTDISLKDTQSLFPTMEDYKNITVKSLGLNTSNYLKVPADRSAYGGAWTLIPKTDYAEIHKTIDTLLKGVDLPSTGTPTDSQGIE